MEKRNIGKKVFKFVRRVAELSIISVTAFGIAGYVTRRCLEKKAASKDAPDDVVEI